jgi:hypothetical protein
MENLYFFEKYSTNTDTHTRTSTQSHEHTHIHSTYMSISKILSWLDFDIHRVGHQECITVDGASPPTERIISRKYNTYIKYRI